MAAAMVTPSPAVFCEYNVPPLPSTALRSHTLSTPVTLCTKPDDGKRPSTAASCAAENVSNGKAVGRAERRRPGSSRFRSMLHTL